MHLNPLQEDWELKFPGDRLFWSAFPSAQNLRQMYVSLATECDCTLWKSISWVFSHRNLSISSVDGQSDGTHQSASRVSDVLVSVCGLCRQGTLLWAWLQGSSSCGRIKWEAAGRMELHLGLTPLENRRCSRRSPSCRCVHLQYQDFPAAETSRACVSPRGKGETSFSLN